MRTYKKKRKEIDPENLQKAIIAVRCGGLSFRKASLVFGINFETLRRYYYEQNKENEGEFSTNPGSFQLTPPILKRKGVPTLFNVEQEKALANYLMNCGDLYFGLGPRDVRRLAFEYAIQIGVKIPASWNESQLAGREWLVNFTKRHNLAIRKPEATSLQRASAFNRFNVSVFFTKLMQLYEEFCFDPSRIYNMDETGVTTVQVPTKILSRRGEKHVGRIVSAERGELTTLALAVSATGNIVPPFYIFPRVRFKEHFLTNGPIGCAGSANPSGWMTRTHFREYLIHFQRHTGASMERPTLLILDNHDSHLDIHGLQFCVQNGIVLLTIPPHTSHKLQPLDRCVFGPFKKSLNYFSDAWIAAHPGTRMRISDIAGITNQAICYGVTLSNITSAFACTGIWPPNAEIFTDKDFQPSDVTDREIPSVLFDEGHLGDNHSSADAFSPCSSQDAACQPKEEVHPSPSNDYDAILADIRPYPKAPARVENTRGRKRRRTEILTSPEVLQKLQEEQDEAEKKKLAKAAKMMNLGEKKDVKKRGRPRKIPLSDIQQEHIPEHQQIVAEHSKIVENPSTKGGAKNGRSKKVPGRP